MHVNIKEITLLSSVHIWQLSCEEYLILHSMVSR